MRIVEGNTRDGTVLDVELPDRDGYTGLTLGLEDADGPLCRQDWQAAADRLHFNLGFSYPAAHRILATAFPWVYKARPRALDNNQRPQEG